MIELHKTAASDICVGGTLALEFSFYTDLGNVSLIARIQATPPHIAQTKNVYDIHTIIFNNEAWQSTIRRSLGWRDLLYAKCHWIAREGLDIQLDLC